MMHLPTRRLNQIQMAMLEEMPQRIQDVIQEDPCQLLPLTLFQEVQVDSVLGILDLAMGLED